MTTAIINTIKVGYKRSAIYYKNGYFVPLSDVDLTAMVDLYDPDNYGYHVVDTLYSILEVSAPIGMSDIDFCNIQDTLPGLLRLMPSVTSEHAVKLCKLPWPQIVAATSLLNTKAFRSEFRRSLRDQILNWLNGDSQYSSPLSAKQWAYIVR